MNLTCLIFGTMFSVVGALFADGKIHPHMEAWKRMPPDEKKKIRIGPLCRNIGEIILLSGIIFLFKGLCPSFRDRWFTFAMIAWLIVAGIDVWYIGRSSRYKNV